MNYTTAELVAAHRDLAAQYRTVATDHVVNGHHVRAFILNLRARRLDRLANRLENQP